MEGKFTQGQLDAIKGMAQFAGIFADEMYHIMKNHGLDKVPGFRISVDIDPEYDLITKQIEIGCLVCANGTSGYVSLNKGRGADRYVIGTTNSAEYEQLFANGTNPEGKSADGNHEKPFPPDGLWIGDDCHTDSMDGWEWDVNDSLS